MNKLGSLVSNGGAMPDLDLSTNNLDLQNLSNESKQLLKSIGNGINKVDEENM